MTSILTNTGAMTALKTLRSINMNLQQVQSEISTGKTIGSARDGAAIWSISKAMESDMKGFQQIKNSLSLGQSTLGVARNAAESVTDLLTDMKSLIVSAQAENVDRAKIQTDIEALSGQIQSITGAAQFNGLNLVTGQDDVNVLASLDRSATGVVTASDIKVTRADLTFDAGSYGTGTDLSANVTTTLGGNLAAAGTGDAFSNGANNLTALVAGTVVIGETYNMQIAGTTVSYTAAAATAADVATGLTAAINAAQIDGITASLATATITIASTSKFDNVNVNTSGTGAATFALTSNGVTAAAATTNTSTIESRASEIAFSTSAGVADGDGYRVAIGGVNYDYIAGKNETMEDVARGLKTVIDSAALTNISTNVVKDSTTGAVTLQIDNDGTALTLTDAAAAGGTASGGLIGVDDIDVTTELGLEAALANVETWLDSAISAASSFGSSQGRVDTQAEFIQGMVDTFKAGIGTLVDADMEEASARLQALQVQQQLGIQSLSIANQAPQSILALFR